MLNLGTILISIFSAIIVALITPYFTHKLSVRYFKKEFFFKEKIKIFEKIGSITWKNHFILTNLELLPVDNGADGMRQVLKQQILFNVFDITNLLDKLMYLPRDLIYNLGKYATLFELYVQSEKFGDKDSIKKLRDDKTLYVKNINLIVKREINNIK